MSKVRPCLGCKDRYPACGDDCKKPEYIHFCELEELRKRSLKRLEIEEYKRDKSTKIEHRNARKRRDFIC
jgi:hypothetical protein